MTKKQKLELTWIGKETRSQLELRILLEDPEQSYNSHKRFVKSQVPEPLDVTAMATAQL